MRWKSLFLIIVLSAILSHYNVQSSETDRDDYDEEYVESVETVKEHEDHDNEVKQTPESVPSVELNVTPVVSFAPNTSLQRKASAVAGVQSGKYLDYGYMSNYDLNDQNYDWNGK